MRELNWSHDGRDWPNGTYSTFVRCESINWHVQRMGSGPLILLLHGTGASTHSWAELMPRLAREFSVLAIDLPGHGFTSSPTRPEASLPGMAAAIAALLTGLDIKPSFLVGHSAGAAIALQLCLDGHCAPRSIISINGAVIPFEGPASFLFPVLAKAVNLNSFSARCFAWAAQDQRRVRRLISQTGSSVSETYFAHYARLLRTPAHVAGALRMMAHRDLTRLFERLRDVDQAVHFLVGDRDRAVPPQDAYIAKERIAGAEIHHIGGLGHLAHEEDAERVGSTIEHLLASSTEPAGWEEQSARPNGREYH